MNLFRPFVISLIAAALALIIGTAVPAQSTQAQFVSVIEDLPLMPGLAEDTDAAMAFDSAAGRIVEARATGAIGASVVKAFYAKALPQLGWKKQTDGGYVRGDERLGLEIIPTTGNVVTVSFRVKPGGS